MYIPVIFFCLISGECNFLTADLFQHKTECQTFVIEKLTYMDKDKNVSAAEGACLPVKFKQI